MLTLPENAPGKATRAAVSVLVLASKTAGGPTVVGAAGPVRSEEVAVGADGSRAPATSGGRLIRCALLSRRSGLAEAPGGTTLPGPGLLVESGSNSSTAGSLGTGSSVIGLAFGTGT